MKPGYNSNRKKNGQFAKGTQRVESPVQRRWQEPLHV